MNQILEVREEVIEALDEVACAYTGNGTSGFDRVAAQQKITELEGLASGILELTKDRGMAGDFFESKLTDLYDERAKLLSELDEDEKRRDSAGINSARLHSLMTSIRNSPPQVNTYNDALARELVESVKVIDGEKLMVVFKGDLEVEVGVVEQ